MSALLDAAVTYSPAVYGAAILYILFQVEMLRVEVAMVRAAAEVSK